MTLPPYWGSMLVKHAWNTVPENWVSLDRPPAEATIDLHIALNSQRENALIDALYEVSSPGHPKYVLHYSAHGCTHVPLPYYRYGAHLSKGQVAELITPHTDTLYLVNSWLEHNGMSFSMVSMTHGGSWLTVSGVHVSQANDLLGASYQLYRHTAANTTVLRTISYGLPAELHAVEHLGNPRGVRTILLIWQRCSISNGPAQGYTKIWLLTGVSRRQLNMEQCEEDLPQLPGPVVSEILASTRFSSLFLRILIIAETQR